MQLSKEEYARKRIHNGSSVQIENRVTQVTNRHHSASFAMPNSYPRNGIFNPHLTTIKDSYTLTLLSGCIWVFEGSKDAQCYDPFSHEMAQISFILKKNQSN